MTLAGKRILVVEDEPGIRANIVEYFRSTCKADVKEAADGKAGFEVFAQNPDNFDIVLSDLNMEPVDGLSMIDRIKSTYPDAKVLFAILSTEKSLDHRTKSKELGIRLWMLKPFDGDTLGTALAKFMDRHVS